MTRMHETQDQGYKVDFTLFFTISSKGSMPFPSPQVNLNESSLFISRNEKKACSHYLHEHSPDLLQIQRFTIPSSSLVIVIFSSALHSSFPSVNVSLPNLLVCVYFYRVSFFSNSFFLQVILIINPFIFTTQHPHFENQALRQRV